MPAAAARALKPMATRTPLTAMTAVQALCKMAKMMLDKLMNLLLTSSFFGHEPSELL